MDIVFPKRCIVEHAQDIKAMLLEALARGGEIRCSFKNVVEADLSFFQLLTALKRSCEESGRLLTLTADLPPHLSRAACVTNWAAIVAAPGASC
ncbi:STAS domain-containing protein [Megalodesulfovibrio gigas]|uniref:MlaB-like STAS domain-containing protein n=1 Tax=Megalodesulfovibrio gigas (strain ATCC 19364 / DSM 1382 / NCIMB 9332 / VKM B-1759) TaxID=1121448 RepID=T2G811_MEGG1|nr:STAS domain-containing protein [Megalodesulfovibrio gigas]AGW12319.1 hypothetical protein DGI_0400 [Megalodesulfovibrio gigas DSM 1382 = ATCC 19364]